MNTFLFTVIYKKINNFSYTIITATLVYIITSIAHRIKNPLRRTSEHITLHDLKH